MTTSHDERMTAGWTADDSSLGARLALVRHRMGWNVKEAAKECGVPAASWRSWEEGAQPRRLLDILRGIAERTGCDYMWLLMGPRATSEQHPAPRPVELADDRLAAHGRPLGRRKRTNGGYPRTPVRATRRHPTHPPAPPGPTAPSPDRPRLTRAPATAA